MHRIDGPGATANNRFTEGDPVAGTPATVVTDDFMNDVQEELISVLTAAGIAPTKGTQNQIYLAIAKIIQGQSVVYFPTSGTSTAQILTPIPAITSYAVGQRFSVTFNVASSATPTIKVSGLISKFLKQYDGSGVKVTAVWAAGQISDIVYDGADWVMLDVGASAPAATTVIPGIARFGTPAEQAAGSLASVMANPQGVMALVTAMFPKRTFTANDFVRIPDVSGGLIIQWGRVEDNGATNTFPTPFGTQGLSITATIDADAFQGGSVTAFIASNSQFRIREAGSVTAGVFMRYIAIGF